MQQQKTSSFEEFSDNPLSHSKVQEEENKDTFKPVIKALDYEPIRIVSSKEPQNNNNNTFKYLQTSKSGSISKL